MTGMTAGPSFSPLKSNPSCCQLDSMQMTHREQMTLMHKSQKPNDTCNKRSNLIVFCKIYILCVHFLDTCLFSIMLFYFSLIWSTALIWQKTHVCHSARKVLQHLPIGLRPHRKHYRLTAVAIASLSRLQRVDWRIHYQSDFKQFFHF